MQLLYEKKTVMLSSRRFESFLTHHLIHTSINFSDHNSCPFVRTKWHAIISILHSSSRVPCYKRVLSVLIRDCLNIVIKSFICSEFKKNFRLIVSYIINNPRGTFH